MAEAVERMEKNWAPSVPLGGHVLAIRLGELLELLMSAQLWLDHLRRQPGPGIGRGEAHARNAGLGRPYAECRSALAVDESRWPSRRSAAVVRLVAALLDLPAQTIRRRIRGERKPKAARH